MFALRNGIQRAVAPSIRSLASQASPKNKIVPDVYKYSFNQSWLSDPSTYPIIIIMCLASTFMLGMSANALSRYRGVKILPEHKNSIMNDWDSPSEPQTKITEVITRRPIATHWGSDAFKSLRHEGLGVDHEEWKKRKAQEQKEGYE